MKTLEWWATLDDRARASLIARNGDAVAPDILESIVAAGGDIASDAWWVGRHDADGFHLSDEATDWIETVANGE
ncbi:hypothetical protein [Frigoribacterium sp. VKM Ac-2836]|uniref:hypothetical protein n=1 Tax=Frigoribacterium sp. VKM Ac-2836 TaxID=2739014 RepID=UPI001567A285|nr:hypothetical protein [Frigoribacterium sp. VKM Ac-2836]NRD26959.1 hypothetical protein [Frigoribacterium sp. VKM Ac-2836]